VGCPPLFLRWGYPGKRTSYGSGAPPGLSLGCASSEGGAPFVARRAVNLHGSHRPHCAPRSSYCGGTPAARSSYRGAPPPAAATPDTPVVPPVLPTAGVPRQREARIGACAFRAVFPIRYRMNRVRERERPGAP
jgi:hypothetical protein